MRFTDPVRVIGFVLVTIAGLAFIPTSTTAQTREYSCPQFFKDYHQSIDCIEAFFTETPDHLTLSGVPPGNGMALGGVLETEVHYVSPFAPLYYPALRSDSFQPEPEFEGGYKSLVHPYVTVAGSTNSSWFVSGGVDWLPPLHYKPGTRSFGPTRPNGSRATEACHRLGPLCTRSVFGISLYASHRDVQSISFYGLGSNSPPTNFAYEFNETYGGVSARMPIFNWLTVSAVVENRQPDIPASNVALRSNFTETTAPGVTNQPDFMHYETSVITSQRVISEPASPADLDPMKETPPLMKHRFVYTFADEADYHWYSDTSTGHYSFQQFDFTGDETIQLGGVIQEYVPGAKRQEFPLLKRLFYDFISYSCGVSKWAVPEGAKSVRLTNDLRVTDPCDFGKLDFRAHLDLSHAPAQNAIPFYMLPTIGGSDINSVLSLRGFDNYRFRAPDAVFLQAEYGYPVWGPIGSLIFYDAGNVGQTISGLSFADLRQDAGTGLTLRFSGSVVAEGYLALGAGHGAHFGYTFTKFF